jgi:hypothetical protein
MDYLSTQLAVENAIGGKSIVSLHKLMSDASKSVWPANINDMTFVFEYIFSELYKRQKEKKIHWENIWFVYKAVKNMAPKDHDIPRVLVGHYFEVLTTFQNLTQEISAREAGVFHAAFGDLIEAYSKSIIRANHTHFINSFKN